MGIHPNILAVDRHNWEIKIWRKFENIIEIRITLNLFFLELDSNSLRTYQIIENFF